MKPVYLRISIAVNRHCDNSNSSEEELAYTSKVWSIIIMVGSMTECMQAWYWRGAEGSASDSSGIKSKPLDLV